MRPKMAFPSARRVTQGEIKFRAWSIKAKTMSPATTLEGWVAAVDNYSNEAIRAMFDKFIIMLFTCLKDANGTEIYESDIVEITKDCPAKGLKNVVEWKDGGWHVGDGLL